jgi:hypothetical protein
MGLLVNASEISRQSKVVPGDKRVFYEQVRDVKPYSLQSSCTALTGPESMISMDEETSYRKRIVLIVAGILIAIPILAAVLFLVLGYFVPL